MESTAQRWKKMRYEAVFGTGMSDFLGELGGRDAIGRDYFYDLEYKSIRPLFTGGLRYRARQNHYINAMLTYGWVSGDDKLTKEYFRNNRNLHFRSPIVELSAYYAIGIGKEQVGRRYRLGVKRSRMSRYLTINLYPWAGISVFYFNPKAKDPIDEHWYPLQPMGTEGQGIVKTRRPYSRVQFAIPYGIGFKYALDKRWLIAVEYGIRKTFTDYIDDVSTTYFDNTELKIRKGAKAAYFANPSTGPASNTAPGVQRGDPTDKDSYMFMTVTLNYKMVLKRSRRSRPKF